ncbi:MAG: hypothetical protein CMJ78_12325 [Planctomycetaceae bacterium]|nr:hypothetical protein [Planctomycetaceae bacterium]
MRIENLRFHRSRIGLFSALFVFWSLSLCNQADAQIPPTNSAYEPLSQNQPPGMAALWARRLGRNQPTYYQPVKVQLPSTGTVTFFQGDVNRTASVNSGESAGLMVGQSYRFKISNMPEFPGVELYPSIEIIDRLHPPAGQKYQFPIPLFITIEELELAITGRLVTRVVYLEQPELAAPTDAQSPDEIRTLMPADNLLKQADIVGRPLLIMRLGSRSPSIIGGDRDFFGSMPRVEIPQKASTVSKRQTRPTIPVSRIPRTSSSSRRVNVSSLSGRPVSRATPLTVHTIR